MLGSGVFQLQPVKAIEVHTFPGDVTEIRTMEKIHPIGLSPYGYYRPKPGDYGHQCQVAYCYQTLCYPEIQLLVEKWELDLKGLVLKPVFGMRMGMPVKGYSS
ncbi:hypothetical protein ACFE04_019612 [Oxalis oulophora]